MAIGGNAQFQAGYSARYGNEGAARTRAENEAAKAKAAEKVAMKRIAALVAVREALVDALAKVAPDHPLNDKELRNAIYDAAFDKA